LKSERSISQKNAIGIAAVLASNAGIFLYFDQSVCTQRMSKSVQSATIERLHRPQGCENYLIRGGKDLAAEPRGRSTTMTGK
jgi:hypothetical protein